MPGKSVVTLRDAVLEFEGQLAERRSEYEPALPAHITPERFQRVVVTAVNLNPDLLKADRRSLLNAAARAASDGLLPDGRDGALVIFNTKEKVGGQETWIKKVQWMPMVAGIIKKARQSGEISALGARIVYSKEIEEGRFTHKVVDGVPKVDHDPILWGERGAKVLVYSFVRFKDGSVDFEFLHADDVAKIRAVSKAKFGPWFDWEEEMWKKTAIRRHAKRLPVSSELFDAISQDDELTEFGRQRNEAENKMLTAAREQLSAPLPVMDNGDVIDGTSEEVEEEESILDRGCRLLSDCETAEAVKDVAMTIADEIEGDSEQLDMWEQYVSTRLKELKGKRA